MTDWQAEAKAAVMKAVPNQGFQRIALRMALCTERAAEYLLQAPALVMAASYGRNDHDRAAANIIVGTFGERCHRQPKLRALLEEYRLAYGFRALRGVAIAPSRSLCVFTLSQSRDLHPSALAQAIPKKPIDQLRWLGAIMDWGGRMAGHNRAFSAGLSWAAVAAGTAVSRGERTDLTDIADFYVSDPSCFSVKWSLDEARSATERWHRRIGKEMNEEKFYQQFGRGYSETIDYDPLPLGVTIGELHFVALDTGEELYAEGRMMHHCVGTYTQAVLNGAARIYSIRAGDRRLATLELGRGHTFAGDPFVGRQLKGPCNSAVSKVVREAARTFVESINAPLIKARNEVTAARRFAA